MEYEELAIYSVFDIASVIAAGLAVGLASIGLELVKGPAFLYF